MLYFISDLHEVHIVCGLPSIMFPQLEHLYAFILIHALGGYSNFPFLKYLESLILSKYFTNLVRFHNESRHSFVPF